LAEEKKELTDTLGLARISTWRFSNFIEAAETLIKEHSEIEEVTTSEFEHGEESWTDVYCRFRSELVAGMVKEKIDGEVVYGRKMQVTFA